MNEGETWTPYLRTESWGEYWAYRRRSNRRLEKTI